MEREFILIYLNLEKLKMKTEYIYTLGQVRDIEKELICLNIIYLKSNRISIYLFSARVKNGISSEKYKDLAYRSSS